MPELPEIEHLSRSLEPWLAGAVVRRVDVRRRDVVRGGPGAGRLLAGERITRLTRHGKQLAIVSDGGAALCVHLGMSGQLLYCPAHRRLDRRDHVHCVWRIESPTTGGRLVFRDPRRFGGLWDYPSLEALRAARWARLGPDALRIDARTLRHRLAGTRRDVKAALLDQRLLAGVGNIYADEILFAAGIHPCSRADVIPPARCRTLAAAIRRVLRDAIRAGGSSVRDYVDGRGEPGSYAERHRVYGRGGRPCVQCGGLLTSMAVGQRTTVCCPRCQRLVF